MKATKILLIATLGMVLFLFLGCTEVREESVKMPLSNLTIKGEVYKTEIIEEVQPGSEWTREDLLIVTGKVIEIRYRPDILVFEDGIVISANGGECFIWQLGKIHRVTIGQKKAPLSEYVRLIIREVQIID